ncbi:MAG TPA: sulfotransferase domain-containing protein [Ilumatobacteraceae bacterium]
MTKPQHRRALISARDRAVSMVATGRSRLRSQRPLPDFIVAGVQKGGTTFLYQEMLRHPGVKGSLTKEVHFFDAHFDKGVDWYSGMFPRTSSNSKIVRGEASPAYIFHPAGVRRIAETLPDARLIVVLRDPVQRALSHYKHERRLGFEESETFEEALSLEESRVSEEFDQLTEGVLSTSFAVGHFAYTRRGLYAQQLKRAADLIGRDRLLILISEEMFLDPIAARSAALEFVGAEPLDIASVGDNDMAFRSEPMEASTEKALREQFAAPNAELAEFLGRDLPW